MLMVLSSAGYIGGKLARKPGPKIGQVIADDVINSEPIIKISGINLSLGSILDKDKNTIRSRIDAGVQVYLTSDKDSMLMPFDHVFTVEEDTKHPGKFCMVLAVKLSKPVTPGSQVILVKVINADGQMAVWKTP